jgi:hypothetical protein
MQMTTCSGNDAICINQSDLSRRENVPSELDVGHLHAEDEGIVWLGGDETTDSVALRLMHQTYIAVQRLDIHRAVGVFDLNCEAAKC